MAARKSMKAAAAAGTSVFDQIASGNAQAAQDVQGVHDTRDAKDVQDVQRVQRVQDVKDIQTAKNAPRMERLNLKIPTEIKEYLTIAAARASIEQRRTISLTQYLCDLVAADKERHGEE